MRKVGYKTITGWVAGCVLIVLCGTASADKSAGQDKIAFNINATTMARALIEFTQQSGLQLAYPTSGSSADKPPPRVVGNLTPREALDQLLKGSGLKYEFTNDRTISVSPANAGAPRSSSAVASAEPGGLRLAAADAQSVAGPQQSSSSAEAAQENDETQAEVVVSGTRLRNVETYAPVQVFTREEIKRRGFNTMEDIIRALPSNLTTLNSATGVNNMITGTGSQGNMTFDLRGMGPQNTLVLVNGRRLSGAAALDGNGANVAGIPVNAIERIEIVTDGGSAIYGSDAVAGTVNIILRKDFAGSETLVRYEDSGSDANSMNASQMVGIGWGSGNFTANLSYQKMKPIVARKTGYTTLDLSGLPGGYDGRGTEMTIQTSDTEGALGPNVDPNNFTVDDIDPAAIVQTDQVEKFLSPDTTHMGLWTTLRQQLTPKVTVNLDVSYNKTKTTYHESGMAPYIFVNVPASSPVNPTGEDLYVSGPLTQALEAGLVGAPFTIGDAQDISVAAGLGWELPFRDWRWQSDASYSKSKAQMGLHNQLLVNYDANYEPLELEAAIANGTFNPFDQTAASRAVYDTFIGELFPDNPDTKTSGITSYVEGRLAQIPTGQMRMVMGGEFRTESASGFSGRFPTRPSRDISAAFTEFTLPLVNRERHVPGVASLDLKVAARWEEYVVKGASFNGTDTVNVSETFTNTSPNVQLSWHPVQDLKFNASWGQSFRAPGASDLFSGAVISTINGPETVFDPLKPGTNGAGGNVDVNFYFAGNPVLQPETSDTTTLSLNWTPHAIRGLQLGAAYSKIDFSDRIGYPSIFGATALAKIFSDPATYEGFTPRDANGNLLAIVGRTLNQAVSISESIDFTGQYAFSTDLGTFTAGLLATYVMDRVDQQSENSSPDDLLGNSLSVVDRLKGSLRVDWDRSAYGASVVYNFASDYDNIGYDYDVGDYVNFGAVDGISIWDLTGFYRFGQGESWRMSGGAKNVFDEKPAAIAFAGQPYDSRRVDLRGRVVFVELSKSF